MPDHNIYDLFSQLKTYPKVNLNEPVKMFDNTNTLKPKGLTMRSFSNTNDKKNSFKETYKVSPRRNLLSPISQSRRSLLNKQSARFEKKRESCLSKIKQTQNISTLNTVSNSESKQFNYSEPEVLAHDIEDSAYYDLYLESPFIGLTSECDDEGFISDPDHELFSIDEDSFEFFDVTNEMINVTHEEYINNLDIEIENLLI